MTYAASAAPDARQRPKRKEKPPPIDNALAYTLADASRMSGLSPATLRRRAAAGKLRLFRCGGRRLACGPSLRAMMSEGDAD